MHLHQRELQGPTSPVPLCICLSVSASVHVWHITHKLYIRYTLYMHAAPPATQAWNIHDNWHQILWQHWDVTLVALPS